MGLLWGFFVCFFVCLFVCLFPGFLATENNAMSQVLGGEHPKDSGPGILTLASGRDTESSQDSPLSPSKALSEPLYSLQRTCLLLSLLCSVW